MLSLIQLPVAALFAISNGKVCSKANQKLMKKRLAILNRYAKESKYTGDRDGLRRAYRRYRTVEFFQCLLVVAIVFVALFWSYL